LPKSLEIKVANSKFRSVMDRCTARGQVFSTCNPQFLNALLTRLRLVFLMPNEQIFKKGDLPRELCFVFRGACAILNDEKVKRVLHHDAPDSSTILGEVPFFFGVLHGYHCRSHADGDVQLLVLSKADGDDLFNNYPEQLEIIRSNILASMGLDTEGNVLSKSQGQDRSEEDPDELAVFESVCEALKSHADETFTALTYAARSGDVEELQSLIRRGANINHVDYDGRGALAMAAVEGNFKVVELLLQEDVDRNCRNRWEQTPLQEAIAARQGPVVELLLQWRAHINADQSSGALCSAASTNDMEQLKRLVENKANLNQGDYDNRTPLHLAAAEGHDKAAEYLLEQKANPCVEDRFVWWRSGDLGLFVRASQP
jgi:ankyrin repeat protein